MIRWQVSMWLRPQRISPNVMIERIFTRLRSSFFVIVDVYVEYVPAHPVVSLQLGTTFWASHFLLEKSTVVVIAFDTVDIDQPAATS